MKAFTTLMARAGVALAMFASIAQAQAPKGYAEGEFLVKFRQGVGAGAVERTAKRYGAEVLATGRRNGVHRLSVPKGRTVAQMVQSLGKNPNVVFAEPNFIAEAHADSLVPTDALYSYQWHLQGGAGGLGMEQVWGWMDAYNTDGGPGGDTGVIVAVVDTGVAYEDYQEIIQLNKKKSIVGATYSQAPDLAGTNFVPGYDFVNNDAHPNDDEGHGTHVTGTIAQSTTWSGTGYGVAGVAPDVSIMPVKVLDASGSGTYFDIADGITFAADNGADVINMSLGGSAGSSVLEAAVAYAYGKGVTIVCSAGNSGYDGTTSTVGYPAAYGDYCIAVSATDYAGQFAYYSSGGPEVDIAAPGGDVYADLNGDGYGDGVLQQTLDPATGDFGFYFYQGTSMASPHVAGVAALLVSTGVTGPDAVRAAIEGSARDLGSPGVDTYYGYGMVDPLAALTGSLVQAPDVAVAFAALPGAVLADVSATIDVDVSNTGTGDALDVAVSLYDGEALIGSQSLGFLAAGGTLGATFTWTPSEAVPTGHSLRAEVTATDDTNPGNDTALGTVLVTPYTTNIRVAGMDAPATTTVGMTEGIDVTLVNEGIMEATVTLDLDGDPYDSVALDAGEQTIVTLDWSVPDIEGAYLLEFAAATPGDEVDDNTASATVTISAVQTMNADIAITGFTQWAVFTTADALVSVVNGDGAAMPGATVTVAWSGAASGSTSGITDSNGQVTLTSPSAKKASGGVFTATISSVTKEGAIYTAPTPAPSDSETAP